MQDLTLLISTIATSIGTVWGIVLSVYNIHSTKRIHIKLDVRFNQKLVNPLPGYDADSDYVSVRAVNLSPKKTVKISSVGYVYLNRDAGVIFSDTFYYGTRKIESDDVADFLAKDTFDKRKPKVAYFYATTLTGKTFKKYITPRVVVWGRDFLHYVYLWRKKPIEKKR